MTLDEQKLFSITASGRVNPQQIKKALSILECKGEVAITSTSSPQKFLTVKETMTHLGNLSRTGLWKLRRKGLPHYRIGAKLVFKPEEVEDWLRKNQ